MGGDDVKELQKVCVYWKNIGDAELMKESRSIFREDF